MTKEADHHCKLMSFEGQGVYLYHVKCPKGWADKEVVGLVKSRLPPPWKPVNFHPTQTNADLDGRLSSWDVRVCLEDLRQAAEPEILFTDKQAPAWPNLWVLVAVAVLFVSTFWVSLALNVVLLMRK